MKRMMTAAVLGLVAVGVTAPAASATFIYDVHFADPSSTGPGAVTVDGTITVARLGTLGVADITGYSLAFTSARNPKATLTGANRDVLIIGGAVVTASATSLSVFLPPSTDPKTSGIQFTDPAGYPTLIALIYVSGQGVSPLRFLANDARVGTTPPDSAFTPLGVSGPFVLATAPAIVPEPSSLVTAGTAAVVGVGYAWRKRRRALAA